MPNKRRPHKDACDPLPLDPPPSSSELPPASRAVPPGLSFSSDADAAEDTCSAGQPNCW